jgi:hypothetical protein
MTRLTHPVSPEEIMASLDGELTAAQQQSVQRHMDQCDECAQTGEQFRRNSEQLHSWTIETVPSSVEDAVVNQLGEGFLPQGTNSSKRLVSRPRRLRFALIFAGSAAALLLIGIIFNGSRSRARMMSFSEQRAYSAERSRDPHPTASMASGGYLRSQAVPSTRQTLDARGPAVTGKMSDLNSLSETALPTSPPLAAPMIARAASLSIVVKNVASSRANLDMVLVRHHGYAANLTMTTPENMSRSCQASLRVPAAELASALSDIKSMGWVENETQSGEEVTQQHTDLIAHLKNARETEQRFQAILQRRTGKVEDVLEVEREIARVRGEIETMEADQQVLEHRVDFASVDLQLAEEYQASLSVGATPSISTQLHNALVSGYRHARDTTLAIVFFVAEAGPTILILVAIFGVPAFFLIRRYRRMRTRLN